MQLQGAKLATNSTAAITYMEDLAHLLQRRKVRNQQQHVVSVEIVRERSAHDLSQTNTQHIPPSVTNQGQQQKAHLVASLAGLSHKDLAKLGVERERRLEHLLKAARGGGSSDVKMSSSRNRLRTQQHSPAHLLLTSGFFAILTPTTLTSSSNTTASHLWPRGVVTTACRTSKSIHSHLVSAPRV